MEAIAVDKVAVYMVKADLTRLAQDHGEAFQAFKIQVNGRRKRVAT